jgi:hypothetical protein
MNWTDCLLGKIAAGSKPAQLISVYRQLIDLGFSCFDVSLPAGRTLLQAGIPADSMRFACEDLAQLDECISQGWRRVRLTRLLSWRLPDDQLLAKIQQQGTVVSVTIHELSDLESWQRENCQQAWIDAGCLASLILHDAYGNWDYSCGALVAAECQRLLPGIKLEFQGNSIYQMGTAAALGTIHAGAATLICTVGGAFDEIAWEEVWLALFILAPHQHKPIDQLVGKCREILAMAGLAPVLHKPLLGDNVFAHESGIHVHGVLRQPAIYEAYAPEDIGQTRLLTIGGSSGRIAVETAAALLGYECPAETVSLVNSQIKKLSAAQGHGLTRRQLQSLFFKYCNQRQEAKYGSVAASC